MKLGIVVPIIGNFGRKGFYHSQEIGLGKAFSSMGHTVIIYKCVPIHSMQTITIEEINENLRIIYIPTKSIGPHGLFDVTKLDITMDGIIAFADTQLSIPKIYRFCKINNIIFVPYVGIAHSFQKNVKSKIIDFIFAMTTLRVYKEVPVLAKTEAACRELCLKGVQKCIVAPVGLDFDSLQGDYQDFDRQEIRNKWGFACKDVIISYVARLKPEKRPLEMLDIFYKIKIKNKKLLMVGKGPLLNQIRDRIVELGIQKEVVLFEEIGYQDMWQIHYMSDYFINLRSDEIFGMAIMEAVYYESCVLAIEAPGPETILNNMQGHYLCENYSDIEKYLNSQVRNEEKLKKDSIILKENFSWNICANSFLSVLKEF